ncbi:MAG: hypothetical protein JST50_15025 [Bacteroidetes bacterium]|jgi:hypothetical protein|nr:hypothetical protein [Bacteroidota bacterium]
MSNTIMEQMLSFIKGIGLEYHFETIEPKTFLPGLDFRKGALIIDRDKLLYPGDILHEAGHLACMPPDVRKTMTGDLENNNLNQGGEMMAIAWSYAVCLHLGIRPEVVFHENGYKGSGGSIVDNFNEGNYFGVPLLEWCGMCYSPKAAKKLNAEPFPSMISWTCEKNMYMNT